MLTHRIRLRRFVVTLILKIKIIRKPKQAVDRFVGNRGPVLACQQASGAG